MTYTDSFREFVAAIPFVDHHVHQPYKRAHAISLDAFRRPFTEGAIPAIWQEQLPSLIGYRWMVRALATMLGVSPDEYTVLAARNAMDATTYHRLLASAANLDTCYADDLFAQGECYTVSEWAALIERPVRRVLRIETFIENGFAECPMLDDALAYLTQEIAAAPQRGIVSLKSIAGYRTGLAIVPPVAAHQREARAAYARIRETAMAEGSKRIAAKPLVDAIVWAALEAAAPQGLPIQFHVAFGDDDIVLRDNDPTVMRALFRHEPFRTVPFVLLHCYPYHQHAGYLASIYPNVYVDLGLTIPIVGPRAANILAETLELTPTRQLLASTDGHMEPEFQWFGVHVWRWAITRLLGGYVDDGIIAASEAEEIAMAALRDNALRIYPQHA